MCSVRLAFGELELQAGRPKVASPMLRRAERMAARLGIERDRGYALSLQAECARLQHKPEQALALSKHALLVANPGDSVLVRMILNRAGDALFDLARYDEAATRYNDAAKLPSGSSDSELQLSRKLASCFAATGKYRQAYLELGKHLGRAVESNKRQLSRVVVIEREIAKLRAHSSRDHLLQRQEDSRRIALSEALREVERQRKEIIRLEESGSSRSRNPEHGAVLRSNETRQNKSHRALALEFPTFSPTELRIAGLIRQSVATKKIASLIQCSNRTVEWHRASIRKKLQLARAESLETHLIRGVMHTNERPR